MTDTGHVPPKPTAKRKKRWSLTGRRRRGAPGATPGTLIADPHAARPNLRVIGYGPSDILDTAVDGLEEIRTLRGRWPVMWVNVDGLGDLELLTGLGEMFGLHRLALEDIVNVHQRPKVEEYEDDLFIITRALAGNDGPETIQVAMFLTEGCLLTLQERPVDCFAPIRERIHKARGIIRQNGPDYLAYAILDAVIDHYFPALEATGEYLAALEDRVVAEPDLNLVPEIHDMKRDLLAYRRAIWPQREMLNALVRDAGARVTQATRVHLRDCYDHTIHLMDTVETYRDIAASLVDIYLSSVGVRTNEIMKVLAVIATIFIPLSFIAGLYGMNFDRAASPWNMPELGWAYGYPFALSLMAATATGLLLFFRKRGWIGRRRKRRDNGPP